MNDVDFLAEEIFLRYGNIKRARSSFLYTEKGKRLIDLYQENGRAILGWGGGTAFTKMKNALDRGATGSFKTCFSYRLEKACNALFFCDDRKVFVFQFKSDCFDCALSLSPDKTFVYKPWKEEGKAYIDADCIIFEPPLPLAGGIYLLAVKKSILDLVSGDSIKRTIKLSSPLEVALTRTVYNLISAIQVRQEKDWFIYDKHLIWYWERKGPYLYPKVAKRNYKSFLLHCLDLGLVISPIYEEPSIVPFGADKGVFECLGKNPFDKA